MLKDTGHGLIANGQEDAITPGSEIANVWDKIKSMFPWYRQINDLIGTSLLVDKSALAHSTSVLDLTVLTASSLNESIEDEIIPAQSPKWDIEDDEILTSPPLICHASPLAVQAFDASSDVASPLPSRKQKLELTARPTSKPKIAVKPKHADLRDTPTPSPMQHKSMGDQIAEVFSASSQAQAATSHAQIQARLALEDCKNNTAQKVEQMHIDFQREQEVCLQQDQEACHQHELLMIDRQIELEQLQHGFAPPVIDPNL
ncbi:hypothetical protein DFH94DRAFT_699489 [Russula ochroleuca]|uniref:Uncharacterized protein n=1 Tax=Russula ochroleuca TaxID=152965 RepID=A0A9P5MPC9_9AGAM|nr:hypothetical protein DFH94DRAFT_699489 [Russula ochroleuca]